MLTRIGFLVSASLSSQDLLTAFHRQAYALALGSVTGWPHVCPGISLSGSMKSSVCGWEQCDRVVEMLL